MFKTLSGKYDEAPSSIGLADDGSMIKDLKKTDGAPWTIIDTLPHGYSREVASGEAWMPIPVQIKGSA